MGLEPTSRVPPVPSVPYPKPSGPMTKFYLAPNEQYSRKGEHVVVSINNHTYHAVIGTKQELPEEVVSYLESLKSRTMVPNIDKYDPDHFGVPRRADDFFNPQLKPELRKDFDIERL